MGTPVKFFKKKTHNYYEAPRFYQRLFDLGVPERYWYVTKPELNFAPISYEDDYDVNAEGVAKEYKATPERQRKFMKRILKLKPEACSGVVSIGSQPTADMALAAMFYLAKHLFRNEFRIQIHNVSSGLNHLDIDCHALFIYNVNAEDDPRRLQDVRDVLFATQGLLRVVAFAGDNPMSFFCEKLRYYPNMYLYLLGKYRRVIMDKAAKE